jgi:hypothetical protein
LAQSTLTLSRAILERLSDIGNSIRPDTPPVNMGVDQAAPDPSDLVGILSICKRQLDAIDGLTNNIGQKLGL